MKRFILKTLIFISPLLFLAGTMEVLLRQIPNDYKLKNNYLDTHASEINTLILGSSHVFYGLNPVYFSDNTFNASHISQSLNYDYEIVKKFEKKFENLSTIILPISYFTLFGKLEMGVEPWRVKNYNIYYDINTSKSLKDHTEILGNKINVNIQRIKAYYISGKSNISCTPLGWGLDYTSSKSKDLLITGKTAVARHTKDDINSEKWTTVFKENKAILRSIIAWAKAKNIQVLLFTPPAFETYRNNLNKEQLNRTIYTINQLVKESDNCTYINLLRDSNFVAKDFYDADHLNDIGAKKLSLMINNIVTQSKQVNNAP